jgi:hypothetical protein
MNPKAIIFLSTIQYKRRETSWSEAAHSDQIGTLLGQTLVLTKSERLLPDEKEHRFSLPLSPSRKVTLHRLE